MSSFRYRTGRALVLAALAVTFVAAAPAAAAAQSPDAVRDELLLHFDGSMEKFIALAKAFPADKYTWAPAEGVMEVGQVLMHVSRYNYAYPSSNLGAKLPAGVELGKMEAVRDRDEVIRSLEQSHAWVKQVVGSMSAADLAKTGKLYGRDVQGWAVLVQLVSHMNEHLGQSVAYARMNGIVPPWSR